MASHDMNMATSVTKGYGNNLQRACDVFGLVHCTNGGVTIFRENLARPLSIAVNFSAKILGGSAPLRIAAGGQRGEMDAVSAFQGFGEYAQLARYSDLAFVPAVEWLTHHPSCDQVLAIKNRLRTDPGDEIKRLNWILEDLYGESRRQAVIEESLAWQTEAEDTWAGIQSIMLSILASSRSIFACKADLLHQDFLPRDKAHADALYDQLLQGKSKAHADVVQVQDAQRKFHVAISESSLKQRFLGWVYIASYARLTGPYVTGILLFEGDEAVADEVSGVLQEAWRHGAGERGYCYHWPLETSLWAGTIAPGDVVKRDSLLRGLKSVSLAEMYVRPRCLVSQPTFVVGGLSDLSGDH